MQQWMTQFKKNTREWMLTAEGCIRTADVNRACPIQVCGECEGMDHYITSQQQQTIMASADNRQFDRNFSFDVQNQLLAICGLSASGLRKKP